MTSLTTTNSRMDPAAYLSEECMLLVLSFLRPVRCPPLCNCCGKPEKSEETPDRRLFALSVEDDGFVEDEDDDAREYDDDVDNYDDLMGRDGIEDAMDADESTTGSVSFDGHDDYVETEQELRNKDDDVEQDTTWSSTYDALDAVKFYHSLVGVSRRWKSLLDSSMYILVGDIRFDNSRIPDGTLAERLVQFMSRHRIRIESFFCGDGWQELAPLFAEALQKCDTSNLVSFQTSASMTDFVTEAPERFLIDVLADKCGGGSSATRKASAMQYLDVRLTVDTEASIVPLQLPGLFSLASIKVLMIDLTLQAPNGICSSDLLCPFVEHLPSLEDLYLESTSLPAENDEVLHIRSASLQSLAVHAMWPGVSLSLACPNLCEFRCLGVVEPALFHPDRLMDIVCVGQKVVECEQEVDPGCVVVVVSPPCQFCVECPGMPPFSYPFEAVFDANLPFLQ
ncbi:expressed unknown protein [Seminavis robusta]|uniref:Uncharacterized protein n=1 Tax=Seminavis robusta TaxID=568900 RepID=A0A9N8DMV3_9STRA|nr:expressed unknown protein [Seminavis robusta]|eukprot:Sro171_g075670.1 n/a (453) ;mRNA; r:14631-15989